MFCSAQMGKLKPLAKSCWPTFLAKENNMIGLSFLLSQPEFPMILTHLCSFLTERDRWVSLFTLISSTCIIGVTPQSPRLLCRLTC